LKEKIKNYLEKFQELADFIKSEFLQLNYGILIFCGASYFERNKIVLKKIHETCGT